jgi:hypothetical protein
MLRARRFGWLAGALLAAGCSVYTSRIRPDAALHAGSAYLYGRFYIRSEALHAPDPGGQSMGLVIGCEDGRRYSFGSNDQRDVQVLEISPSRCWLLGAVMVDTIVLKELPADRSIQRPLDFTAGRAHYLGDYFAKGDYTVHQAPMVTHFHWEWAMSPADDRYESTTADMRRAFPNLASLPTIDMRLIPEPKRKLGNGLVATPGEPPMSPERVARVAPFIKRSYPAPAACEAACPAGQCLPYRGESGPAMACVIRCNKDRDCPEGLACNCPGDEHGDGADCHPIATLPQDPMARICLSVEATSERR